MGNVVDINFVVDYFKKHEGRNLVVKDKSIKLVCVSHISNNIHLLFSYSGSYTHLEIFKDFINKDFHLLTSHEHVVTYGDLDKCSFHVRAEGTLTISKLLKEYLYKWVVEIDDKKYFALDWE